VDGRYDVAVVGAGLVGLATAFRILERRPGWRLAVVEKEPDVALHQSGRNSGVVHSGIYYTPGSLKARLCREGGRALVEFVQDRRLPYRRCGKVIVAVHPSETGRLRNLLERGRANGIEGLEEIGPERLRELEPHVTGLRALHVPETGIVDFPAVARTLADEVRGRGGDVHLGRPVTGMSRRGAGRVLSTAAGDLEARLVVTCAGLHSDRLAAMGGAPRGPRIVPFRGDYFVLSGSARDLVRGLVYPVPDPALPFLGVHFTPRVDGEVWAGPNAVLAFAREGYGRFDLDVRDLASTLAFGGFWRMARRHWRMGLGEMRRDLSARAFAAECRRYVRELRDTDLIRGPAGVRAQAVAPDGSLLDDFSLVEGPGLLHVRNAPSPAATACLAIGRVLAERAVARLEDSR
jgi:L-2-hydroxyglutarate oxidase